MRRTAALLAIVVAGAAARVWRISFPALTSDEAFSWRLTTYPAGEMVRRAAADVHPPLYYLALKPWLATLGDDPFALRALSVTLGLLTLAAAGWAVHEARRLDGAEEASSSGAGALVSAGVLVTVALVAFHPTQVLASRNARMYALGTLLAGLTAGLLFRSLAATRRRAAWWAAYGLGVAAFGFTHYYAVFTVAGQAGAALGMASNPRERRRIALGIALAGLVATAAFGPWLRVLLGQAAHVRAEYWIPPLRPADIVSALASWCTGLPAGPGLAVALVAAVALVTVAAAREAGPAARALLAQALVPWALVLAVSALGPRPIFLERYMVFAQVPFLCFWGAAWPRPKSRVRWAALFPALLVGAALVRTLRGYPDAPPAVAQATRFLKRQAGSPAVVVVDSPRALNKVLYYARQADASTDVRCVFAPDAGAAHFTHTTSLRDGDVMRAEDVFATRRIVWRGRDTTAPPDPPPPGWTITFARMFEGGGDTRFLLARYEPMP